MSEGSSTSTASVVGTDRPRARIRVHTEGGPLPELLGALADLEALYETYLALEYVSDLIDHGHAPSGEQLVTTLRVWETVVRHDAPLVLMTATIESPGWVVLEGIGTAVRWVVEHVGAMYRTIQDNFDPRKAARRDIENDKQLYELAAKMRDAGGISDETFRSTCSDLLERRMADIGVRQRANVISLVEPAEAA